MTIKSLICVLLFALTANAETIGRSGNSQQPSNSQQQDRSPGLVSTTVRGDLPGNSSMAPHSGLQTLVDAANAVCAAATWVKVRSLAHTTARGKAGEAARSLGEKITEGCQNVAAARQAMHQNIQIDPKRCKLRDSNVEISTYGCNGDGFVGGSTLIGPMNPSMPTAASPDPSLLGKTIIVRDPVSSEAHAVVITDRGPAKWVLAKHPHRKLDFAEGSFGMFGLRCPNLLHNMEIWTCEDPAQSKTGS